MTIIIPAYNPDEHLIGVLDGLKKYKVVVVDDGSKDKSIFDRVKKYRNVKLLTHDVNKGKGMAMKTGMEYVYDETDDDGMIFVDADGQHRKEDIEKVIAVFEENKYSLVIGSRCFKGKIPWKSKMGNNITRSLFKAFTFKEVKDTQSGLRAINTKFVPYLLNIKGDRYDYEMNVLLGLCNRINIIEVPIETVYEDMDNSTSHFKVFRDSFLIYKSFLKFLLSGLLCFLVDFGFYSFLIKLIGTSASNLFLCNIFSRIISGTLNYNLNKKFVFRSKKENTLSNYIMLALGIILLNSFILNIFINTLHINAYLAKFLVETILFILNFIIEQKFIFNERCEKI